MKLGLNTLIILLAFSLFCGVFIISLGIGAEFTSVNTIMNPLVCGSEKMEAGWEYNVRHPGRALYGSRWLCVDEASGAAQDASTKTTLLSGTVYGVLIFTCLITSWLWTARPRGSA